MRYTKLRNQTYYFRFRTPKPHHKIGFPPEICISLKTDSYQQACDKISSKLALIRTIKTMTKKADRSILKDLYTELTDFTTIDSYSSAFRDSKRNVYDYDKYSRAEEDVRSSLSDGNQADFSDVTITQPPADNEKLNNLFSTLFLRLVSARTERFYNGHTTTFDDLLEDAKRLLPVEPLTTPIHQSAVTKPVYLLKDAWKDFKKTKKWTKTKESHYQRIYEFMVCYFGEDKDVRSITKQNLRESLIRYSELPVTGRKPYYRWSIEQIMDLSPEDVEKQDRISSGTVEGYLKLLQGFFNAFLFKQNDVYDRSITDGLKVEGTSEPYGIYTNPEIQQLEKHALSDDCSSQLKWLLLVAIYTGARQGEITEILNNPKKLIKTDKDSSISYFVVEEGKTENASRFIPISQTLLDYGILDITPQKIVYPNVSRQYRVLREKLGIPPTDTQGYRKVFHSFRHTFITKCVEKGVQQDLYQQCVGHSTNAGITERYIHVKPISQLPILKAKVIDQISYQ